MTPLRDPVKNIVYNATAEDVDRVWVDGRLVSTADACARRTSGRSSRRSRRGERMWPRMNRFDWAGRSADALSPQTYPEWA